MKDLFALEIIRNLNNMKPKYIEETVGVPLRMSEKLRDKWKIACAKEKVSYRKWIENRL